LKEVKAQLRARGPLGNRDFTGQKRVNSYRGRKDSALALYYLWLTGEVMVHHRAGFQRVYDFRENVVPPSVAHKATTKEAEGFFARKVFAFRGLCTERGWASWMAFFVQRPLSRIEARRWLNRMMTDGEITPVMLEGEKDAYYLLTDDAAVLFAVSDGRVPEAWRPLDTTAQGEVVFLAPLDPVSAGGRAKKLFGFDYLWEVYKPAASRRWGYYTLPILYGDQLVARLDAKLNREAETLIINGFWLENERTGKDADFAEALARGLLRLARFVKARQIDASAITPLRLRRHIETTAKRAPAPPERPGPMQLDQEREG